MTLKDNIRINNNSKEHEYYAFLSRLSSTLSDLLIPHQD